MGASLLLLTFTELSGAPLAAGPTSGSHQATLLHSFSLSLSVTSSYNHTATDLLGSLHILLYRSHQILFILSQKGCHPTGCHRNRASIEVSLSSVSCLMPISVCRGFFLIAECDPQHFDVMDETLLPDIKMSTSSYSSPQLYELDGDPKRKEFLDDLFSFMQKRGMYCSSACVPVFFNP